MKLDILDINKLIVVNSIEECTSPGLFSAKDMFDPKGVLSNEIFGISKIDRSNTYAYIDLSQPFMHPHVYEAVLKRLFGGIVHIVAGTRKYIVKDGMLSQDDENGWTGLRELYNHWDEIDWDKSTSTNERSLYFLKNTNRDDVFITKLVICPPFYRDVLLSTSTDSSVRVNELNKYYTAIIRMVALLTELSDSILARRQYTTQASIQESIGKVYNYFKDRISKKHGLIKRYLMGKSVTYGTRAVISAPSYNNERLEDNIIDIEHSAVPISQCCSMFYPFIESWVKNFFTREIINDPNLVQYYDMEKGKEVITSLLNPELQFSEKEVKRSILDYVKNPDNRFKPIILKAVSSNKNKPIMVTLKLKGKQIIGNNQVSLNRPLTMTDILYLACVDVCEKRHLMISRYPVGTDKGIFFSKIRVRSTVDNIHIVFNGVDYPFYPDIDMSTESYKVGVKFIDTLVFSNSFLEGMGGDYDGDMCSGRGLWTDESNIEAEQIMNRKLSALTVTGSNIRVVSKEVFNSLYELTKIRTNSKVVDLIDTQSYLGRPVSEYTRSFIASVVSDTVDISQDKNAKKKKSRYNTWDIIKIPSNYFYEGQEPFSTTIGRFIFNKFVLFGSGIINETKYIDIELGKSGIGVVDQSIGRFYLNDVINRTQFNSYIDRRDTLGYWLNGMLAHSISLRMAKPLPEIEKKKKELYKKYEKEIAERDLPTMNRIEKELVSYAKDILKDDPGMDLYLSGDLNFNNNYKNNSILKGPVYNELTNEYDFVETSFMNGIEVKDLPAHANSIVAGGYPSAIATKVSGYMGKQLLALLQMMELDEPGTDCGTKRSIPITVTDLNKNELEYSYFVDGGQIHLLDSNNFGSYLGQTLNFRSPMVCTTKKICNKCAGELFYKLDVEQFGMLVTQVSHSALNLSLKSKHVATVSVGQINVDTIIEDL